MARQVPCPHCKKMTPYEGNPCRPFCGERCRKMDLGKWASDAYAIPGKSAEVDESNVSSTDSEDTPSE